MRQQAARQEGLELIFDEPGQLGGGADIGVGEKLAAGCCTRRYSVVCWPAVARARASKGVERLERRAATMKDSMASWRG
jgi:hypothetical protein